jgi:prepilin-type processing-associated H-X9-DG protein
LLPVISSVRRSARAAECQSHLTALMQGMSLYLKDNKEVYPGKYKYKDAAGAEKDGYASRYNLVGREGIGQDGDKTPKEGRVLNQYVSDPAAAQCPLDRGTRQVPGGTLDSFDDTQGQFSVYEYNGCSYVYPARSDEELKAGDGKGEWALRDGMWMIGGHRESLIENPQRKLILADGNILPQFPGDHPANYWHGSSEPLMVNVAYADGHAVEVPRKTKAEGFVWEDKTYKFDDFYEGDPPPAKEAIRKLLEPVRAGGDPKGAVVAESPYY